MESDHLISSLNKKLNPYCLDHCEAKCCRIGKLFISEKNAKQMKIPLAKRDDGYYELHLPPACPFLKDNKCSIYEKSFRPKMCGEYPFFLRGKTLFMASSCSAVKAGLFDEDIEEIESKGFQAYIQ